jgi:hypothetical protein
VKARKSYLNKMSRMPLEDNVVDERTTANDKNKKDVTE